MRKKGLSHYVHFLSATAPFAYVRKGILQLFRIPSGDGVQLGIVTRQHTGNRAGLADAGAPQYTPTNNFLFHVQTSFLIP